VVESSHGAARRDTGATQWASPGTQHNVPSRAPNIADIARIAGTEDPVLRNLRITQCYYELSNGLRDLLGPAANWCSHACWTSKQAGRAIRASDLTQRFRARLNQEGRGADARRRLLQMWLVRGIEATRGANEALLDELLTPDALLARWSEVIATWNFEAFSEIGLAFGRFLGTFRNATRFEQADIDRFCRFLQEEPDQDLLSRAFRSYHHALFEQRHKLRAERMLLGNLLLCLHEQRLLQPHIESIFELEPISARELPQHFLARHEDRRGLYARVLRFGLRRSSRVHALLEELAATSDAVIRQLISDELGDLHSFGIGDSAPPLLERSVPQELLRISLGELDLLLSDLGANPEAHPPESSVDHTVTEERMRMLSALLLRSQDARELMGAPFSEEQCAELQSGRIPKPPL